MSAAVVALFFAIGVSGWVYAKFTRSSGGASSQNTAIVVGIVGVLAFLIALSIMTAISD